MNKRQKKKMYKKYDEKVKRAVQKLYSPNIITRRDKIYRGFITSPCGFTIGESGKGVQLFVGGDGHGKGIKGNPLKMKEK